MVLQKETSDLTDRLGDAAAMTRLFDSNLNPEDIAALRIKYDGKISASAAPGGNASDEALNEEEDKKRKNQLQNATADVSLAGLQNLSLEFIALKIEQYNLLLSDVIDELQDLENQQATTQAAIDEQNTVREALQNDMAGLQDEQTAAAENLELAKAAYGAARTTHAENLETADTIDAEITARAEESGFTSVNEMAAGFTAEIGGSIGTPVVYQEIDGEIKFVQWTPFGPQEVDARTMQNIEDIYGENAHEHTVSYDEYTEAAQANSLTPDGSDPFLDSMDAEEAVAESAETVAETQELVEEAESRLEFINNRMGEMQSRMSEIDMQIEALEGDMAGIEEARSKLLTEKAELETKIEKSQALQNRIENGEFETAEELNQAMEETYHEEWSDFYRANADNTITAQNDPAYNTSRTAAPSARGDYDDSAPDLTGAFGNAAPDTGQDQAPAPTPEQPAPEEEPETPAYTTGQTNTMG